MAIILFVFCLGFLIFIHELGHFLAAKKSGIKVEEFGLGYPPRIWGFKKKGTIYSINALPFGGFVKILGEDGKKKDNKKSFASRKPFIRIKILAAGIAVNLIFGTLLLGIGYFVGLPVAVDENNIAKVKDINLSILSVSSGSPADNAGVKSGDVVLKVMAGAEEASQLISEDFQNFVKSHQGKELTLVLARGKNILEKKLTGRLNPPEGQGSLGVMIGEVGTLHYSWWQSIIYGVKDGIRVFLNIFVILFYLIKGLFTQNHLAGSLVGPVGIAVLGGQTVKLGLGYALQFLAGLSVNLAAINLIPFPGLDGSRILFVIIEKLKGKPVSIRMENLVHSLGFATLILLTIIITTKDIIRLF
ncbi:MAG: site-2 protease family protein [bacterium]|nr:site-2 protease family protein [bacterium]